MLTNKTSPMANQLFINHLSLIFNPKKDRNRTNILDACGFVAWCFASEAQQVLRIACNFLHLLGAEAEAHPGYGVVLDHIYLFVCLLSSSDSAIAGTI
jgi:hypothetical protein